jgi:hypothetical protein
MPWKPIARKCKQKSTGKTGSHAVVKVKKDGGTEQESCHTSEKEAEAAIRARHASKNESIKISREDLHEMILTELYSDDLLFHVRQGAGVDQNIHRPGSDAFFALFKEVRVLSEAGLYRLNESECNLLYNSNLGDFGYYNGERVPLDYPMLYNENLYEAEYKGRKVKLNKPKRSSGGKAYVYVNSGKKNKDGSIKVKKVTFGSSMPDAMGDSDKHKARRKSFGLRHNCADKKDKTKPGYWSCRLTKFFGRNISGWW